MQKLEKRLTRDPHLLPTAVHPGITMTILVLVCISVVGSEFVMLFRLLAPINGVYLVEVNMTRTPPSELVTPLFRRNLRTVVRCKLGGHLMRHE